jgi:exopolysaccharide biosynthesis polyprenyl glycosylphosphotransferase
VSERALTEEQPLAGVTPLPGLADPARASVVSLRHPPRDSAVRRVLGVADAASIVIGLLAALAASGRELPPQLAWSLLLLPAWIVLLKAYGLYDRDLKRVSHTTVDDVPWLFHAVLVGSLLTWLYQRLAPAPDWRFAEILVFAGVAGVAMLVLRSLARRALAALLAPERVLLIGHGEALGALERKFRSHPEYGLEPVGAIADPGSAAARRMLRRDRVDRIVVSHGDIPEHTLLELLRRCKERSIKVSVLPQLFDAMGPSVEVDDVEGVTVLGINPPVLSRSSRALKRGMDVAGAALGLVLTAPFLLAVAAAIKLDSRGPVFFTQERIGKGGRRFRLFKFRTMVANAEELTAELAARSRDPNWLLLDHDPRITRVGRVLRMTSLDELPQLVNVLRGEMSLVGPRPIIESEDRLLTGWERSRIDLTPGLTGLWQVLGRTRIPFDEMVKLDYLYVTNWSLWTDVRLLVRTLPTVLTRRGAN